MYTFGALLMRMNYISRWGLMRNTRTESLSEHVVITATIANLMGHISKEIFGADVNPELITCRALYHDAGEILNGDLPTPVKYRNETIKEAYIGLERESEEKILGSLPQELQTVMRAAITGETLGEREEKIVKAADRFSALLKCIEEEQSGNTEFKTAKKSILERIQTDMLPETEYFLTRFIPAYTLTLDELLSQD